MRKFYILSPILIYKSMPLKPHRRYPWHVPSLNLIPITQYTIRTTRRTATARIQYLANLHIGAMDAELKIQSDVPSRSIRTRQGIIRAGSDWVSDCKLARSRIRCLPLSPDAVDVGMVEIE